MKFEPYSYFGGTPKKVTGTITSAEGKVEWVLNGTWDSKIEGSKVIGEATVKGKSSLEIGASKLLWKMQRNDEGAEKYYNFRCVLKIEIHLLLFLQNKPPQPFHLRVERDGGGHRPNRLQAET